MKKQRYMPFIASVFLSLLVSFFAFSSCGIPVLFSAETSIKATENDTITATITIDDELGNLALINSGTGPSLFLAYIVTHTGEELEIRSKIISAFRTTYQGTMNNGRQVPTHSEEPILISKDDADDPYRLYILSKRTISRPTFHATSKIPINPNTTVQIASVPGSESNTTILSLTWTAGDEYTINTPYLVRYNGSEFSNDGGEEFPDYLLPEPSSFPNRYCHIFAAINVSDGKFTNIYWSDLTYLGAVKL